MLWPYVRNPGDCLTDAEIKAGQTGTYNGPVNTNPDISGIRIEKPAQNVITTVTPSAPVAAASRPLATAPARELTSVSPNGVRTNLANVPRDDAVSCHKGVLWPFRRQPGDCLTSVEKERGQTGVYGGGSGITQVSAVTTTAAPATNAQPGSASTNATPAANGPTTASADTSTAPPVETCHKGLLWPFVKRPGDCPTASDKKGGR